MASRLLQRVTFRGLEYSSFTPAEIETLAKAGIRTCRDLLDAHELQLSALLDKGVKAIVDAVSQTVCPAATTAMDIHTARSAKTVFLPIGLDPLDAIMKGGLPIGTITEVCGPPGVGKTQFCFTSAVALRRLFNNHGTIYFDIEGKFSAQRLLEIARARYPDQYDPTCTNDATLQADLLLQSVAVLRPETTDQFIDQLQNLEALIIEGEKRLVIVDSIAALARKEFEGDNAMRQAALFKQASLLKRLAYDYDLCVLVTNQVTPTNPLTLYQDEDAFVADAEDNAFAALADAPDAQLQSGDVIQEAAQANASYKPSLGTGWHHCISSRLVLKSVGERRTVTLTKSPLAGIASVAYRVTSAGISPGEEPIGLMLGEAVAPYA